jgi:hypothetical protein
MPDPQPPWLYWSDVMDYTFMSEFELLKNWYTRADIWEEPWTTLINREGASQYWKVKCAQEEITRLNIEIQRLHRAVQRNQQALIAAIDATKDQAFANELQQRLAKEERVNARHIARLTAITRLQGYTGEPIPTYISDEPLPRSEYVEDNNVQESTEKDKQLDMATRLESFLEDAGALNVDVEL